MSKIFYILIFFIFLSKSSQAQKQNNIWYFGDHAGLDFNSGLPVPLTNGQTNTIEGVSSIADANGSLLFYTDGLNVFNSNHLSMPNGNGLFGGLCSSQSALIVPKPGSTSLYYIFTVPEQGSVNPASYSIVDMTLQGGLGDVTIKNTALQAQVTEKLTATRHANGQDYWIVIHGLNSADFYAFLLTAAGVSAFPVTTNIGLVHADPIGYAKISPSGNKLAVTLNTTSEAELFDFNNSTGVVTNPVTISALCLFPYGIEFSPDNSKLYVAESGVNGGSVNLYQFDLLAGSSAAIIASGIIVGTSSNTFLGPLQLAPDYKIYVGRYSTGYVGIIDDPNQAGVACSFVDSAVFLGGQTCLFGLPNQVPLFNGSFFVDGNCLGDSTFFSLYSTVGLLGAQWDFGDPGSGINNISFVNNPSHYYAASGTYTVSVVKYYSGSSDTISLAITIHSLPVINLGPDTVFCTGTNYVIQAGQGFSNYLWQDGSTDSVFIATISGSYWVTVSDSGCTATDTIIVNAVSCNAPSVSFYSSDTIFCDKQCLDFTDISTNTPTSWQWLFSGAVPDTSTDQHPVNICYNAYGTFDVTLIACNGSGCDTLYIPSFITEHQLPVQPVISQSNDTLFSTPSFAYAWYNTNNPGTVISTDSFCQVGSGGDFFVIVTDSFGCQNTSGIFVTAGIENIFYPGIGIIISPNPVVYQLSVNVKNISAKSNYWLEITDILGQPVYTSELVSNITSINLHHVVNGLYYLRLKSIDGFTGLKFIVYH